VRLMVAMLRSSSCSDLGGMFTEADKWEASAARDQLLRWEDQRRVRRRSRSKPVQVPAGSPENCDHAAAKKEAQALTVQGPQTRSWHAGLKHDCPSDSDSQASSPCAKQRGSHRESFVKTLFAFLRRAGKGETGLLGSSPNAVSAFDSGLNINVAAPGPSQLLDLMSNNCKVQCCARMKRASHKKGEKIVRLGEIGNELFVIESGTAEASLHGQHLQTLDAGSFFGEISFMANCARRRNRDCARAFMPPSKDLFRMCDVVAVSDCECWVLSEEDFVQVLDLCDDSCDENIELLLSKVSEERLARIRAIEAHDAHCNPGVHAGIKHVRFPRHLSLILSRCLQEQLEDALNDGS
jgi:CRP-like cAMP-binding protein